VRHAPLIVLCAFAVLGAVFSGALYLKIGNSKQILAAELASSQDRATRLQADLAAANEQTGSLKAKVATLESTLDTTRTQLTATAEKLSEAELRAVVLDHDLAKTKNLLVLHEQNATALAAEVASLRADLDDSRNSNASPEAVVAYKSTIAELEKQLATARNGATAGVGLSTAVFTNRSGRATVLNVGPSSAFVVLNFGSNRGAQLGQRLTISQGTEIVATVLISDVRTAFSIAQVQPDTLRGVLQKGDSAVLVRTP
jgi:septal ring factor EnvC (AmiA/AmiB activator)